MNFKNDLNRASDLLPNRSLLLEMLDRGSGDTMSIILGYVTSLKEKIRLERVCRSFRKHARTFQAWSSIKSVEIRDASLLIANSDYWMNSDIIAAKYIATAIESVLYRSRNVCFINLVACKRLKAYGLIGRSITEPATNKNIRQLFLSGWRSPDVSFIILLLIDALKTQLSFLQLVSICFMNVIDMERMWNIIGACVNLESFTYLVECYHIDGSTISPEMVKLALRGKAIRAINILLPCIDTANFIEIVSSFSDPRSLRHLMCSSYLSLTDFARRLPATFDNLNEINYNYVGSLTKKDSDWSVILRLPSLASKLTTLSIRHSGLGLDLNQVVELIVTYLTILNNRANAIDFKLRFYSATLKKGDINTVKESLIKDHGCQIEQSVFLGSSIRIRCVKDSRASIEI